MDTDLNRRWSAHCHRMAEATRAIADWCDDPEMMNAYEALAARWTERAQTPPAFRRARPRLVEVALPR